MAMGPKRAARAASKRPMLASRSTVFGRQLQAFAEKTEVTVDEAFRGIVIELFSSIIADTPVDQGRARGNWQTSVGSPKSGVVNRLDDTGMVGSMTARSTGGAIAEVFSTQMGIGDVVWLSNNLPYIGRLEYENWSGQAPHGMVRKNMARVNRIVNDVVKGKRKL